MWIAPILLLAACGSPQVEGGAPTSAPSQESSAEAVLPAGVAERIVADADNRLPEAYGEVEIVLVEPVTFSDSSLGCPEPGVEYETVEVDGFSVVLETQGGQLVYKADDSGAIRLCAVQSSDVVINVMAGSDNEPRDESEVPGISAAQLGSLPAELANLIIADAAATASVEVSAVGISAVSEETFNDGSLGCPAKGQSYVQVLTPGWIVMVTAGSTTFEYHAASSGYFVNCS